MEILKVDKNGKFNLIKLQIFHKKKDLAIKYAVLYIHKENRLVQKKWHIIIIIKNLILIDSKLLNRF